MPNRTRTIKYRPNRSNRSNRPNCLARHTRKRTQTGGGIGRLGRHALNSFLTLKQRFKQKLRHLPGIRRFTLKQGDNIRVLIDSLYKQTDEKLYPKQQQLQPDANNNYNNNYNNSRTKFNKLPEWNTISKLDKGKSIWPFDVQTAHVILDEISKQWNDLYTKLGIFVKIDCKDPQLNNTESKYHIFYYVKQDRHIQYLEFDIKSDNMSDIMSDIMNAWPTKVGLPPQIDFIIGLKDDPKLRELPHVSDIDIMSANPYTITKTISHAIQIIFAYLNKELFTAVPIYNDINPKIYPVSVDSIDTILREFNDYTKKTMTQEDYNSDIYRAFRVLSNAIELDNKSIYIYNKTQSNQLQLSKLYANESYSNNLVKFGIVETIYIDSISLNTGKQTLLAGSVVIGAKYTPSLYFPFCS